MATLFINACVRENSRTLVLANHIMKEISDPITQVTLSCENILPLNRSSLEKREQLIREGKLDDPMFRFAREFAAADEIIIAAPFWDLSFPALLKIYLEQIAVAGITFEYREGRPIGLCQAKRLTYITTAGGPIFADYGYAYVKSLAQNFYGIEQTRAFRAMNLDVDMITPEALLTQATISEIH